jgi:LuxR family maltose regulon positive regulatory protein
LRTRIVTRPRLVRRLAGGADACLILLSAPAGFGKTTLLREWIAESRRPVAWLSLDEGDNDRSRFLTYLSAALQNINPELGRAIPAMLRSLQPPPAESLLTELLNEIAAVREPLALVLDDYHLIDNGHIHSDLGFLLEHLPPNLQLIIATRADPPLPLARLRGQGRLGELRAGDLRFTSAETADFLEGVMELALNEEEIAALEARTEGWITGLHMAALSMQGHGDTAGFIASFTGSHRFVLDYLLEEVLRRQSHNIQHFLLATSVLERLCGPLCDAVLFGDAASSPDEASGPPSGPQTDLRPAAAMSGQETLEYLEQVNLFIVPLDDERRWYRYHRLFADLLKQRARQKAAADAAIPGASIEELHRRASRWYEANGYEVDAFQHAAAAGDVRRATRLVAGRGMPLQFRGAVYPVLRWLEFLTQEVLNADPSLWVMYASCLSMAGRTDEVEEKLQAAEAILPEAEKAGDEGARNLHGHIAAIRALLAAAKYQAEKIISQSNRALAYLHPDNQAVRTATIWKLGIAYQLRGDLEAAASSYGEAVAISRRTGNTVIHMSAALGLGSVRESDLRLHQAAETYREVLELAGDLPMPSSSEACLGLARIHYQWNDLDHAEEYGRSARRLARPIETTDWIIPYELFGARLHRARGDYNGAAGILERIEGLIRRRGFSHRAAELAAERVCLLLLQGWLESAEYVVRNHNLPLSRARVKLAQRDCSAALAELTPLLRRAETGMPADERLKLLLVHAIARNACGEQERALELLRDALAQGEAEGCIRIFLEEGEPMLRLLSAAAARGIMTGYTGMLITAFREEDKGRTGEATREASRSGTSGESGGTPVKPLLEPLSSRELEVLQLIAQGCSNSEICERLFLALSTVKGHNRNIFEKLGVRRRTEAVARARELGLL